MLIIFIGWGIAWFPLLLDAFELECFSVLLFFFYCFTFAQLLWCVTMATWHRFVTGGDKKKASCMQSRIKEVQAVYAQLSNHATRQKFKEEWQKQTRWISRVCQLVVLLWNIISAAVCMSPQSWKDSQTATVFSQRPRLSATGGLSCPQHQNPWLFEDIWIWVMMICNFSLRWIKHFWVELNYKYMWQKLHTCKYRRCAVSLSLF